MTVLPRMWPRRQLLQGIPQEARLFQVTSDSQILAYCHWHSNRAQHRTVLLVHGLEGSSESHYMCGIAGKAWRAGLNVLRFNQRNCGGSEHLTPTLYHSGLSGDLAAVVRELQSRDGLNDIWVVGYSMGGNLALKMAGEGGSTIPALRGVFAVCPNIDPGACVKALERPTNWFYQRHFLTSLKARLRRKAGLFPGKFDVSRLPHIHTMREFDERYTAPDGGFTSADDYYDRSAARHVLPSIEVPTVIMTAQDDPFIPYAIFDDDAIRKNDWICVWATRHGGHCGFLQRSVSEEDSYWAENRLVESLTMELAAHGTQRSSGPRPQRDAGSASSRPGASP